MLTQIPRRRRRPRAPASRRGFSPHRRRSARPASSSVLTRRLPLMPSPHGKQLRRAYGFDEVAIVPGQVTINPEQTDVSLRIGDLNLAMPVLASAMDGVVDPRFAITFSKYARLAALNGEALQTRSVN